MSAIEPVLRAAEASVKKIPVASVDWMRGLVRVLMVIDHASMAFDAHHLDHDSTMYGDASTMALPILLSELP